MRYRILLLALFCNLCCAQAQDFPKDYFRAPLDIPMYLSGNFGELRSNHYHSGIDIKTKGREGFTVYAAAAGFVSRIKVSPYGYGNALYIDHPNGYTTVYGHLQRFSSAIDSIVKQYQYQKESFAIDEILPPNLIVVKKGERIAISGNSGSSGGPHLHYEIRETASEFPTNPLRYGMSIKDEVAPVMRTLFIYPLDNNATVSGKRQRKLCSLEKRGKHYQLKNDEVPTLSGRIGFGLDARDYMTGTHNYYGIYKLQLYIDDSLQHSFVFDKFSFSESRYINAHIDYDFYKTNKRRVHRLYHLPNQKESFAKTISKGTFFNDNNRHKVRIIVEDAYGNAASLVFQVQSKPESIIAQSIAEKYHWNEDNYQSVADCFVKIPAKALYQDCEKSTISSRKCERKDCYSPLFQILRATIPLHKSITVGIKPHDLPSVVRDKAFIALENKGKYLFVGNKWEGEFLTGKTRTGGKFTVLTDTQAPTIKLWKGSSYKKTGRLRYKIADNLSGVTSFHGEIDGKWVLFEYDAKRGLLWHRLSESVLAKGKEHRLKLRVKDACGNETMRSVTFDW